MTLPQLHYTSAAPSPEGSGFRFTAMSPGVAPEVLRQAEPVLGYEPPRDAPLRPTDPELAGFPVALAFTRLPDGSRLLSRTVYTGADYSGRYGNFHAHAVHLPPGSGLPGGVFPVEAWESPSWQNSGSAGPAPEPLTELRSGGRFGKQVLARFARSRRDQVEPFLADVRRLFAAEPGPQLVVVEREPEAIACWVALACGALPRADALELTFTTYTRRPYRAVQQIVGVLPDAEFGFTTAELSYQYRVHHTQGGPSSPPQQDTWAAVAARIWLAGLPELFQRVAVAPGAADRFDTPCLAALALGAGVELPTEGADAAVAWACEHPTEYGPEFWRAFLRALLDGARAEPRGLVAGPDLIRLCGLLASHWSPGLTNELSVGLARAVIQDALRDGSPATAGQQQSQPRPGLPDLPLSGTGRRELAAELGSELLRGLLDDSNDLPRSAFLLGLVEYLAIDPGAAVARLSARLVVALSERTTGAETARALLADRNRALLRTAVLDRLNDTALDADPGPVAAVLADPDSPFDPADLTEYPHLRAAVAVGGSQADGDKLRLLHHVLRASGFPQSHDPSLLRTGYQLVWADGLPSTAEALMLLAEMPADRLEEAGLSSRLVSVALQSPARDAEAPELAGKLLRNLPHACGDLRRQTALELLVHAEELRAGSLGSGFAAYALARWHRADPLEQGIAERLRSALVERVLSGYPGPGEPERPGLAAVLLLEDLAVLVRSGDELLLRAYAEQAGGDTVHRRLRTDMRYPAACFVAWTTGESTSAGWDQTRKRLLGEVLRPALRGLPQEDLARVEALLEQADRGGIGNGRALERWREWNRPTGLSGLLARRRGGGRPRSPAAEPAAAPSSYRPVSRDLQPGSGTAEGGGYDSGRADGPADGEETRR